LGEIPRAGQLGKEPTHIRKRFHNEDKRNRWVAVCDFANEELHVEQLLDFA